MTHLTPDEAPYDVHALSRAIVAQWRQEKQSRKAQKQAWYCLLWNEEE